MDSSAQYERSRRDGMAIVLIEWRIKPDEESAAAFMKWWCEKAKVKDKSGLLGEFLSSPVLANELPSELEVDDLSGDVDGVKAWRFINVAIWRDWPTFYEQIREFIDAPPRSFESPAGRRRVILEPQEWRSGCWDHPSETCE